MEYRLCFTIIPKDPAFMEFPQHGVLSGGLWSNNYNDQKREEKAKKG